jgi:hypothetical protein
VINDITEPCPECGVPACGKEAYLWVEKDGQNSTLVFDGSLFDLFGQEFFTHNNEVFSDYDRLPRFMKDWNENKGWSDFPGDKACAVSIPELVASLEIIKSAKLLDWLSSDFAKYYAAIIALVNDRQGECYILKT